MIAWLAWFFFVPWLFLVDSVLSEWLPVRVDLGLAIALVLAVECRTSTLPGLLLCAALARSLFADGDLPLHFLALGLPVAAVLPTRLWFFRRAALWQCAVAGFLALTVPRVGALLAELSGQVHAPVDGGVAVVAMAMVTVPLAAWVLRTVPPMRSFREAIE